MHVHACRPACLQACMPDGHVTSPVTATVPPADCSAANSGGGVYVGASGALTVNDSEIVQVFVGGYLMEKNEDVHGAASVGGGCLWRTT